MTGTGDWIDRGVELWIALHLVGASGAEAVTGDLVGIREAPPGKGDLQEQVEADLEEIEVQRKGLSTKYTLEITQSSLGKQMYGNCLKKMTLKWGL